MTRSTPSTGQDVTGHSVMVKLLPSPVNEFKVVAAALTLTLPQTNTLTLNLHPHPHPQPSPSTFTLGPALTLF